MNVTLIIHTPEPEKIIATAARICYSQKADIQTITEGFTDEEISKFIEQLIETGHSSVLEHAVFTFGIEGVSRVLLAEISRHRIASFSVRSQRYCSEDRYDFVIPKSITKISEEQGEESEAEGEFYAEAANSVGAYKDLVICYPAPCLPV